VTPVFIDVEKLTVYDIVQFFVWSKTGVLHIATFKCSLCSFTVTTLC